MDSYRSPLSIDLDNCGFCLVSNLLTVLIWLLAEWRLRADYRSIPLSALLRTFQSSPNYVWVVPFRVGHGSCLIDHPRAFRKGAVQIVSPCFLPFKCFRKIGRCERSPAF